MYAQRLSFFIMSTLAGLTGAAQAQGPWPSTYQPTFYSPVQEFFTPRSYSSNYSQPRYSQYPNTPINPGVPQCANGQCRQSGPNGLNTTSNRCANGQCAAPSSRNYQPGVYTNNNPATGNCPNGQCRNRGTGLNLWGNHGGSFQSQPNTSFGLRPLTPVNPNFNSQPRGGQLNRLVPLDGGFRVNNGTNAPQAPMYRDRESMVPQDQNVTYAPGVRLQ